MGLGHEQEHGIEVTGDFINASARRVSRSYSKRRHRRCSELRGGGYTRGHTPTILAPNASVSKGHSTLGRHVKRARTPLQSNLRQEQLKTILCELQLYTAPKIRLSFQMAEAEFREGSTTDRSVSPKNTHTHRTGDFFVRPITANQITHQHTRTSNQQHKLVILQQYSTRTCMILLLIVLQL